MKNNSFWDTQPVGTDTQIDDMIKVPRKIQATPYNLPDGFTFTNITDIKELHKLLSKNYVEDEMEENRLLYSESFLEWMLSNPKHKDEYSLGLRFNNTLVGYIFGKETLLHISGYERRVAAINLLCVCKDMRNIRMAPVLIKEMTRRFNCNGIFQGVFTAGLDLAFDIVAATYFHKPLNSKKLLSANFTNSEIDCDVQKCRTNTRRIVSEDIPTLYDIFTTHTKTYKMYDNMDIEDFTWLLQGSETETYCHVEDDKITAFGSYYTLDTLSVSKDIRVKGAYLHIVCGKNVKNMVADLLYYSKERRCDVFNCLDIAGNDKWIKDLNFLEGTGNLKYYLYNWKCTKLDKQDVFFYLH